MNPSRSPRFPFVTLEMSVALLKTLSAKIPEDPGSLSVEETVQAMGYAGAHGGAAKVLAALGAYDLIDKKRGEVTITPAGRALLAASEGEERLSLLQRAALSPLAFRRIWRRARDLSQEELVAALEARGFTPQGAERASRIYHSNAELASLATLTVEPDLPERAPGRRGRMAAAGDFAGWRARRPQGRPGAQAGPPQLRLPLSAGMVSLPETMSEADYDLLLKTLELWKDRLVRPA